MGSNSSSAEKGIGNIDKFSPQVLTHVFAKKVKRFGAAHSPIKVVIKKEMDCPNIWQLESLLNLKEIG